MQESLYRVSSSLVVVQVRHSLILAAIILILSTPLAVDTSKPCIAYSVISRRMTACGITGKSLLGTLECDQVPEPL